MGIQRLAAKCEVSVKISKTFWDIALGIVEGEVGDGGVGRRMFRLEIEGS
jgi:hypothetical protein